MSVESTVMRCGHCRQELVEMYRNQLYVFYKCGCKLNKGVDWDWKHALVDGVEYELGTAGSFVHDCPECGNVTYRENMSHELCVACCRSHIEPRKARTA